MSALTRDLPTELAMDGDGPSPADKWDRESSRRALDELFSVARRYNSSKAYLELMQFIGRFRSYSPFNAMLIHTQMPGARFAATARRWLREFRRQIKVEARPLVILQPTGPVLFVFDVTDTDRLPGALPLPPSIEDPFGVLAGEVGHQLEQTIENAKRDGVSVTERGDGSQRAGSIQVVVPGGYMEMPTAKKPQSVLEPFPRRYELILNSKLSRESLYATLVHELGHLYCGHLGTPDPKFWPDRRGLPIELREFEAESICYLVCTRLGLDNPSAEYLAGYVRHYKTTPPISLDAVMKAAWLIEQMGRSGLTLRKHKVA
jgi:hypothetical protein